MRAFTLSPRRRTHAYIRRGESELPIIQSNCPQQRICARGPAFSGRSVRTNYNSLVHAVMIDTHAFVQILLPQTGTLQRWSQKVLVTVISSVFLAARDDALCTLYLYFTVSWRGCVQCRQKSADPRPGDTSCLISSPLQYRNCAHVES